MWTLFYSRATVLMALKHSRKHHSLLILPRRDLAAFLSDFPDSLPLSSMLLPGMQTSLYYRSI